MGREGRELREFTEEQVIDPTAKAGGLQLSLRTPRMAV